MRKGFHLLALAGLSLLLVGCSFSDVLEDSVGEESGKYISVGFSQIGSESVWRTANTASIQESLTQENGYFLLYHNARQKQENQIKAIRSFISQQVDYIVFSPVTEEGWDTVLMEAADAGIPVLVVDRMLQGSDEPLYTAWIGTDAREEGRKAGRWLEIYQTEQGMEEGLRIAVLEGTAGSSAQLGRTSGFEEIMAQHPEWECVAVENGDFTKAGGREAMEKVLAVTKQLDVVVSQNDDMTFGALEALSDVGVETAIISFDAVRQALELVEEGIISVDVECNPLQGPYIDAVIKKLEAGEEVSRLNAVEEMVFTKENVGEYLEQRTY